MKLNQSDGYDATWKLAVGVFIFAVGTMVFGMCMYGY